MLIGKVFFLVRWESIDLCGFSVRSLKELKIFDTTAFSIVEDFKERI
jgi:hypothetical protein